MAALKEKQGANVIVVENRKQALDALLKEIPAGASISAAGSHTLTQIGYDEWASKTVFCLFCVFNKYLIMFVMQRDKRSTEISRQSR